MNELKTTCALALKLPRADGLAGPLEPPEEPGDEGALDFSDPDNSGWLGAM